MSYQMIDGIAVFGEPLQNAVDQMKNAMQHGPVVGAALMADHHLGYAVPVGGVIAYQGAVSPSGVGFDIACGNKAVCTDMLGVGLRRDIIPIMDEIVKTISFGVGRSNEFEKVDHPLFESELWEDIPYLGTLKQKAASQLGTVGSGNHYVDLFTDEQDRVWIGVHFGSRGFGHSIASYYIRKGGGLDGVDVKPVVLDTAGLLGQEYIAAMQLAGEYAYAGRDWVCQRVLNILGAQSLSEVHNHHNFAWQELHYAEDLWVVRKGATPAFPGQLSFIGSTMGEPSVIVEGLANASANEVSFCSTVHGAGRCMSRTEAAGKRARKNKPATAGRISPEMLRTWVTSARVELRGGGLDESPHAYKRLPEVLAAQGATILVKEKLTPVGVAMAGANEFDPYKD